MGKSIIIYTFHKKSNEDSPMAAVAVQRVYKKPSHKAALNAFKQKKLSSYQSKAIARRVVFYDLETSIVARRKPSDPVFPKGMTRRNLIVEIGAVDHQQGQASSTFHRLVDPRLKHLTLIQTLTTTNQNPKATFRFWNKLFYEKKMITEKERAERKHMSVKELAALYDVFFDSEAFVNAKTAISEFIAFCIHGRKITDTPILVAHNGKSFDHSILRHHCYRLRLPQLSCKMYDSIPIARQIKPGLRSYALNHLHEKLVGVDFEHHHALADAHALLRICKALGSMENLADVSFLWSTSHGSFTSLKGVGPKTAKAFRDAGYDLPTLRATVLQLEECPEVLCKSIRNHKSLWQKLRKKWCTPQKSKPRKVHKRSKSL